MSVCMCIHAVGLRTNYRRHAHRRKRFCCHTPGRRAKGRTPGPVIAAASPVQVVPTVVQSQASSGVRDDLLESLEGLFAQQVRSCTHSCKFSAKAAPLVYM